MIMSVSYLHLFSLVIWPRTTLCVEQNTLRICPQLTTLLPEK